MYKCLVSDKCGSCQYLNVSYLKQLELKKKSMDDLFKCFNIKVNNIVGSPLDIRYRNKVIVSFNQKYEYGLYEENSHRIVPVETCLLHDEETEGILKKIQSLFKKYRVSIYDRKRKKGAIRHVLIRRAVTTNQTLVVIVSNEDMFLGSKNFCSLLVKAFPSIKSIVLNINKRDTSIVLGDKEKILYGKGFIVDELNHLKFKISPKSFYQINHDQCINLYNKVIELANFKKSDTVIDTYCGIGTIGMYLAKEVKNVFGVELNKQAIIDANNNSKMNKIDNISFINEDATKYLLKETKSYDVLIMDPPREGSTKEFINAVNRLKIPKVIYVSCGPETMVRDLKLFKQLGYIFNEVFCFDMFPQTKHVESVVLMTRVAPTK